MHTYYANKVRHQLQDVLRMTDANPAFVTAVDRLHAHARDVLSNWGISYTTHKCRSRLLVQAPQSRRRPLARAREVLRGRYGVSS